MNLSDSVLIESKTARDQGLAAIDTQESQQNLLSRVKSIFFALWRDGNYMTVRQVAEYYEVPEKTIDKNLQRNRSEFEADGVVLVQGGDLREVRDVLSLSPSAKHVNLLSPRAVIRMGFILQGSLVAARVRTGALNVLQGVGSLVPSKNVLTNLVIGNPPYAALIDQSKLKISSPLATYYDSIARKLRGTYPKGAIPGLKKDRIRERLAALSTYTQTWKLDSQKEIQFRLKSNRMKYPDLMSSPIVVNLNGEEKKALFLFQIEDFLVDLEHVEECVGRQYSRHAKAYLGVDFVYQILVAPFGATPDAEMYIQKHLPYEERGFVGVLTVKELSAFLRDQAWQERSKGLVKGEINSQFREILDYKIPDAPLAVLMGLDFGI